MSSKWSGWRLLSDFRATIPTRRVNRRTKRMSPLQKSKTQGSNSCPSSRTRSQELSIMSRLVFFALLSLCCHAFLATACLAAQHVYPDHTIRIVVPFSPGGSTDILARIVAQRLNYKWGQPVVVENQPGASGAIGTKFVARANPDGYTLLMASTGALMEAADSLKSETDFDVNKYFAPITLVAAPPYVVTTSEQLPVNSISDLIKLERERPGTVTFGSSGVGAASHLAGELFQHLAQTKMLHVPFKGTGQAVTELLAGRIDVMFAPSPTVDPLVQAGQLKALATTGAKRSALFPKLPTVAESGLPDYVAVGWFGLLAPARTPKPIIEKLNSEVVDILGSAEVRDRLAALGAEPEPQTADEFGRFINADVAKWMPLLHSSKGAAARGR